MPLNIREDLPEAIKVLLQKQGKELICSHFPDGRFQFVSNSCKNILGYMPGELEGKDPYDFIHPEDKQTVLKTVHLPSVEGQKDNIMELRFRRKNGTYIWLQTITQPLFNEEAKDFDIYSSSRDVTIDVENRKKLEQLERLFDAISKMTGIGGWELDLNTGERFWTHGVFDIYERDHGSIIENNINYRDKDRKKLDEAIERARESGASFNYKMRFTSDKGTKKWIQTIGEVSPRYPDTLYGAMQDITENHEALQTIKKQHKHLEKLTKALEVKNRFLLEFSHIIAHNLRAPVANVKSISNLLNTSSAETDREMLNEQLRMSVDSMNDVFEDMMEALKVIQNTGLEKVELNVKEAIDQLISQLKGSLKEAGAVMDIDIDEMLTVRFPKLYLNSILLNFLSNSIKYRDPNKELLKIKIFTHIKGERVLISVIDNGWGIDLQKHSGKIFGLRKTFHRHKDARGLGLFMSRNQALAMGGDIEVESTPGEGSKFTLII